MSGKHVAKDQPTTFEFNEVKNRAFSNAEQRTATLVKNMFQFSPQSHPNF